MNRQFYTIQESDVGKLYIKAFGKTWPVVEFIGRILAPDVGKRVYLIGDGAGGIVQVENDEQRATRLEKDDVDARHPPDRGKTRGELA